MIAEDLGRGPDFDHPRGGPGADSLWDYLGWVDRRGLHLDLILWLE